MNVKWFLNRKKIVPIIYERMRAYLKGQSEFFPKALEIQPTSSCNFSCSYCSYQKRNQNKASLDEKTLMNICNSIKKLGIEGVYISGGGEPLLSPYIEELIYRLRISGAKVALVTNGFYLNKISNIDLLTYIQITLPSVNSEKFKQITGSDCLFDILEMPCFLREKFRNYPEFPTIGAHTILTDENVDEVINILEITKKNGFDYCKFKLVLDIENIGLKISEEKINLLKEIVNNKYDTKFTNLSDVFFKDKEIYDHCWSISLGLIVNIAPDGNVYLCINDIGKEEYSIGNINEKPLEEIWNSRRHKEIIRNLQKRYISGGCNNCRFLLSQGVMDELASILPEDIKHEDFI